MRVFCTAVVALLVTLFSASDFSAIGSDVASGSEQARPTSWSGYMPEKERKAAIKRAYRRSVVKKNFAMGIFLDTVWVTRDVARAVVSRMVDEERLSADEADSRFAALRPPDRYLVHIRTSALEGGLEFRSNSLFLQRAGNRDLFTRGVESEDLVFDTDIRVSDKDVSRVIAFPKLTDTGEAIIGGLGDTVELSLLTQYDKPGLVKYELRQIASSVADL